MELIRANAKTIREYKKVMLGAQRNRCDICGKPFTAKDDAVVDHCHITGHLRGILHRSCNGVDGKIMTIAALMSHGNGMALVIQMGERLENKQVIPELYTKLIRQGARCHKGVEGMDYIIGLGKYYTKYATPKHNLIHHTHHLGFERTGVTNAQKNWRTADGKMARGDK